MFRDFLITFNGQFLVCMTLIYFGVYAWAAYCNPFYIVPVTITYCIFCQWPCISNKKLSIRFLSIFLRKYTAVELISYDNTRYYTLAKYDANHILSAPVYFATNVGKVLLLPNGTVDPKSESSYLKYWLPVNKDERTMHILRCDIPS